MSNEKFLPVSPELLGQISVTSKSSPQIHVREDQMQADELFTLWSDLHIMQITYSDDNPLYRLTHGELRITSDDDLRATVRRTYGLSDDRANLVLKNLKHLIFKSIRCVPPSSIKPVAFQDEDCPYAWRRLSLNKADIKKVSEEDIPEFCDFASRCGDGREALTLWIGSLLDKDSSRAQYLHIKGEGGDGKSTLCDALSTLFGDRSITITANRLKESHFGPELEGARLAIFKDENNPAFFQGSEFKRLTGESTMTVNPKYMATRTIEIVAKVLVTSNVEIRIPDTDADKRRLISVEVTKSNSPASKDWRERFVNSAETILAYCFRSYLAEFKRNPEVRSHIEPPASRMAAAVERNYGPYEEILGNHFKINLNNLTMGVTTSVAHDVFKRWLGRPLNAMDYKAIKKVLKGHGVEERKKHGGMRIYAGLTDV